MGKPMFNFEIKEDFKRRVVVGVPKVYYHKVKEYAAENKIPMADVMRDFLKDLHEHYENGRMAEYIDAEDIENVGVGNWHPMHFSINNSELVKVEDILNAYKVTLPKLLRLYLKRRFGDV